MAKSASNTFQSLLYPDRLDWQSHPGGNAVHLSLKAAQRKALHMLEECIISTKAIAHSIAETWGESSLMVAERL